MYGREPRSHRPFEHQLRGGDQVGSETEDLRALPELNARPLVLETMELPRSA
jgi:hypothetical protein